MSEQKDSQNVARRGIKYRGALGQGLASLLRCDDGDLVAINTGGKKEGLLRIDIALISSDRAQPRKTFNDDTINELADSIKQHGVISPIIVRPVSSGSYKLIAGERRLRAAKIAGLAQIPALLRDVTEVAAAECALIENIQREDLTPIEEANGYASLISEYNYAQEQVAKVVGKSRSHISNMLRILDLPDQVKVLVNSGELSMGHARAIIKADDPVVLANAIVENGMSVRETEKLVAAQSTRGRKYGSRSAANQRDIDLDAIGSMLTDRLGLKVTVYSDNVSITYSDIIELDKIVEKLGEAS